MADTAEPAVQKYLDIVSSYETEFKKWEARVTKILKRYRDENRSASGNESAKFNILWANVQTLIPAVYAKMPKADVSRRFGDNDPVGRVGSLLIERTLDYEIEHYSDFRSCMLHSVSDRFLGGRGVGWARYEPHVTTQDIPADGLEVTSNIDDEDEDAGPPEQIEYECAPTDYVHWKDFGHTPARVWEEVAQTWRWVYMSKAAVTERFGEKIAKKIPFDSGPDNLNRSASKDSIKDKAKICELWDKETHKVYWFLKNYPKIIDERDDPLELEGFFPCPKPLYATLTSDNLVPIPDFVLYQDQANDLDILADRIDGLIKALRVRGIYDASVPELQRLLTEGDNNTLVGTDKWHLFSEKGGLKGTIDLLPLDVIASALIQCYQAEANQKATIYEITGISDIVRGQSKASETLGAQEIKGQYAGLRLRSMQEGVAVYASELLRLMAQIICTKYQDETILAYSAAAQMSEADQKLIPEALELIRKDPLRNFRIQVDADSLVQIDENQNKQDRLEFGNMFSNIMREAVPAGQASPEMVPTIMEVVKFLVGGFKQARTIEGTIDQALEQLKAKAAHAAQSPQPNPEVMKLQAKAQADAQATQMENQGKAQIEQIKGQVAVTVENIRAASDARLLQQQQQHEAAMGMMTERMEQQFSRWEALLKSETAVEVANIGATATTDVAAQKSLDAQYAIDNAPEPAPAATQ